ncbi:MAG: alpha/beta hydrolase [Enhygromyxa sp.]
MLLAHELVAPEGPAPERWMLFLHGMLGRRINWRSFARRWVRARPGWGAVLVDLRGHGDSQGLPGPWTVAAAGADLVPLAEAVRQEQGGRVAGVLGHSFGGKVAIVAAAELEALEELWIIDAPPGPRTQPRDRSTERIFALLERLPERFASRSEFIEAVVEAGVARSVAQWLATNLVEVEVEDEESSWRFGPPLDRLRALLEDFAKVDLWPSLVAVAAAGTQVTLVLGGRSSAVFGEELERAEGLAAAGRIALELIEGAGHWVHVDRPDALLAALCASK